jgi:hypothetical protein
MSYCGTCRVGVNVDTGAVPDADVMMDCLKHGFDEVLAVGGGTAHAISPTDAHEDVGVAAARAQPDVGGHRPERQQTGVEGLARERQDVVAGFERAVVPDRPALKQHRAAERRRGSRGVVAVAAGLRRAVRRCR